MYSVRLEGSFSAAHQLRGYEGDCEQLHGHNWKVEVEVSGPKPGKDGILIDFRELREMLKVVLKELDHQMLNELPAFTKINPTSENVARYIFDTMSSGLKSHKGLKLSLVRVYESEGSSSSYTR